MGVNLPFTLGGFAANFSGTWPRPIIASPQLALGAGALATSTYLTATRDDAQGWAVLTGWSAVTFAHGIFGLALGEDDDHSDYASTSESPDRRAGLGNFTIAPTMMLEGDRQLPGLQMTGTF